MTVDSITPELHAVDHECIVSFGSSSWPGVVRPAVHRESCQWNMNVTRMYIIMWYKLLITLSDSPKDLVRRINKLVQKDIDVMNDYLWNEQKCNIS